MTSAAAIVAQARARATATATLIGHRYQDKPTYAPSGSVLYRIDPTTGDQPKDGAALVFHNGYVYQDVYFWVMSLRPAQSERYSGKIEATRIARLDLDNPNDRELLWSILGDM